MVASSSPGTSLSQSNIPAEFRRDHITFRSFILNNKTNRQYLLIAGIATILQFVIFKILYPYADFFSDSYSYIYGARDRMDINIWPIGYSWFLKYIHFFSSSDTAVVTIQYFFLITSSLMFFYTVRYFYHPTKFSSNLIFSFITFNPLYLYIANYINSDPLFAGLSLLWVTQLIWILQRPQLVQVFIHGILLYLCFIVRNNAMIYPFISALAFLLSNHRLYVKIIGIGFGSLLVLLFINFQRNSSQKLIGEKEFSLFTGWQLANNALYIYDHINVDSSKFNTQDAAELNRITINFFKTAPPDFDEFLSYTTANHFIRHPKAPLKTFHKLNYTAKTEQEYVRSWGKASLVFKDFGISIIKEHPGAYFKYFMLRNTKHYFINPLEKLEVYNLGRNKVPKIVSNWFDYKDNTVKAVSYTVQGRILSVFPTLILIVNVWFLIATTIMLYKIFILRQPVEHKSTIILIGIFWLSNFTFSIFTTMNVLRYQFFPSILLSSFTILLHHWIDALIKPSSKQQIKDSSESAIA